MIEVRVEPADAPDVLELIRLGDEFGLALYPAASYYGLSLDRLGQPDVTFFVARENGTALGTAALVERGDGSGELKRMFVHERARGLGIASRLLAAVEVAARASAISVLQLETGPKQPEAIALYEKYGYAQIPNFGAYVGDVDSYCMQKAL
ncbi:GNAT family N-acetyltransferase [soil metagenome]